MCSNKDTQKLVMVVIFWGGIQGQKRSLYSSLIPFLLL